MSRLIWFALALVIVSVVTAYIWERKTRVKLPVLSSIPDFTLTNQFNEVVSLETLSNEVWVADIIFTRCPMQCLKMSRQMSQLQEKLPRERVRLVSLTADPEFDSPMVLKQYGARFGASGHRWLFLTGPRAEVNRLALEGLKLSVQENDPANRTTPADLFIHSTYFVLIDKAGRLRAVFDSDKEGWEKNLVSASKNLLLEVRP